MFGSMTNDAKRIRRYLINNAHKEQNSYYSNINNDLSLGFIFDGKGGNRDFGNLLLEVAQHEQCKSRPMLTLLAVLKQSNMPNDNVFEFAFELGYRKSDSKDYHWLIDEMKAVLTFWKTPLNYKKFFGDD
jgi:hypothetical protein